MRIAVTGACGPVGAHVVRQLLADPAVEEVVALSRRPPAVEPSSQAGGAPAVLPLAGKADRLRWQALDLGDPGVAGALVDAFDGCESVVHLAWRAEPSHDGDLLRSANLDGTSRVLRAVRHAGVPGLVYASSVGVYSPGPKDRRVDESWPRGGVPGSRDSALRAEVERLLDAFERREPRVRVVRLRPAVVVSDGDAAEARRYFLGPLVPSRAMRPGRLPVVPALGNLVMQLVHGEDVARAFATAATADVRGAFNIAGDPVLNVELVEQALAARTLDVPVWLARGLVDITWRLRLQPTGRGWLETALAVPLLDASRAGADLAWSPRQDAHRALVDALGALGREWTSGEGPGGRTARQPARRRAA